MTVPPALTSTAPTQKADGDGRQRRDNSMASPSQARSAAVAWTPSPGASDPAGGPCGPGGPGLRSAIAGLADPVQHALRPGGIREQVALQHHLTDLTDLGEGHPAVRPMRVAARPGESGRGRVAHEERRDHQLKLVHEPAGQELGAQAGAALDHQAADPTATKIGEDRRQPNRIAGIDDLGPPAEPAADGRHGRARAVEEPLRDGTLVLRIAAPPAAVKEARRRVEITARGDRHPRGVLRQAPPSPGGPALRRADEQPWVIPADGPGPA